MKWVIFTGTWRLTNKEVEEDVRHAVREVLSRGDGIVTGGATGVDFFCMDEVLKLNPECTKLRIFIPAPLDLFIKDYRKNWCTSPITEKDIDNIEKVLVHIKATNPAIILEAQHNDDDITQDDYDLCHIREVDFSDEVYAFQVNNSAGTQNLMDKAAKVNVPTTLHKKYTI